MERDSGDVDVHPDVQGLRVVGRKHEPPGSLYKEAENVEPDEHAREDDGAAAQDFLVLMDVVYEAGDGHVHKGV